MELRRWMLRSGVITFGLLGRQKTGKLGVGYKASHDGRQEDESSLHIGQNGKLVNQMHSGIFGPPQ